MYNTIIPCEELNQLLQNSNLRIVDCRFSLADTESGRIEYQQSHIPGATYAHLDDDLSGAIIPGKTGRHPLPIVDDFVQTLSDWGIDEHTQVVAYDQGHGGIAARLWWMLQWLGHEQVAVLDGGWKAWTENTYPVSDQIKVPPNRNFRPKTKSETTVSVEFVNKIRQDHNYTLIDSRAAERYSGKKEPIDPIAGHIPGAVSAPFIENIGEDGHFLSKEKLQNRFQDLVDQTPPEKTVFYCGSGVTACHNLLAYKHAGLGEAKLYPGSWSEWIVDKNRPIG